MIKPLRILHCPSSIGGNPQGLAKAERELGLLSKAIIFEQNYFEYQSDEILVSKGDSRLNFEVKRWQLLWRALKDFDIIHFNFGQSIMPQSFVLEESKTANTYPKAIQKLYYLYAQIFNLKDLPLLKLAGKGIIVTYQGDDARQGDFSQANFTINIASQVEDGYYSAQSDELKRQRIAIFSQYADRIYALNPDLLHVLPSSAQFLPYSHIDLRDWQVLSKTSSLDVPVVLHAPSHQGAKGTKFILDAVSLLQAEGISFEFILVEGLSHKEARKLYEKADILIDQLLAGWYGGLAVELMALGKPVICYIREDDLKFIPPEMREDLPIIQATPSTIYHVLKQYLTIDKNRLSELGAKSRDYIEKWHNPLKIAAYFKQEYQLILTKKIIKLNY